MTIPIIRVNQVTNTDFDFSKRLFPFADQIYLVDVLKAFRASKIFLRPI